MNTTWRMAGCKKQDGRWVFDAELAEADKRALVEIHRKQIETYGPDAVGDFPDPLAKPVVITLVAERDGKVVDGAMGEAVIEWCHVGCDARAAASLTRWAFGITTFLRKRGFRLVRTFVPRVVAEPVGKELRRVGFAPQDDKYANFLLDIR